MSTCQELPRMHSQIVHAGEVMLGDLSRHGFDISEDHEKSDAIIINTCAFVEDAKSESLETILEAVQLQDDAKDKRVIVTGCLAQRYSEELAEQLPEVDMIMGFEKYRTLPEQLRASLGMVPDIDFDSQAPSTRVQAWLHALLSHMLDLESGNQ